MKLFKKLMPIMLIFVLSTTCYASSSRIPDNCELLRCTCYLPTGNKTADGCIPYEGICASNREHLGQVAIVWTQDMEFVGYFECRDTGSHEGLKNGTRIDIYRDTKEGVKKWQKEVGDWCIIQWVKGEG